MQMPMLAGRDLLQIMPHRMRRLRAPRLRKVAGEKPAAAARTATALTSKTCQYSIKRQSLPALPLCIWVSPQQTRSYSNRDESSLEPSSIEQKPIFNPTVDESGVLGICFQGL